MPSIKMVIVHIILFVLFAIAVLSITTTVQQHFYFKSIKSARIQATSEMVNKHPKHRDLIVRWSATQIYPEEMNNTDLVRPTRLPTLSDLSMSHEEEQIIQEWMQHQIHETNKVKAPFLYELLDDHFLQPMQMKLNDLRADTN